MTEPRRTGKDSGGPSADSWEHRAAALATEVQRWLIKTSAKNMRDELGGQVKKAFRGRDAEPSDVWATATTEPPNAANEPPECAWCPICRAARRMSEARTAAAGSGPAGAGGAMLSDAADVIASAARDALAGLDSLLSYRPSETAASGERPDVGGEKEPEDEPGDRS
ncbi:MAG TPA: hypothetical protein VNF47_05840 [Streptosporangiaceae bacterium]|nr:hypothetical protein [Streptosporangiaceae bacterium]